MATKTASKAQGRTQRTRAKASSSGEKARRKTSTRRRVHNHHWVISAPNGPTSTGTCKVCGQNRIFPNSSEDSIWDGAEGRSRWNDMGISRRRKPQQEPIVEENVVQV